MEMLLLKHGFGFQYKTSFFAQGRHLEKFKLLKAKKAKMSSPSDQFNKEKKFNILGKRCSSKWN